MFERFTERASRAVALAAQEARLLDHDYVGTEHILLALLHDDEGVAARALHAFGITLQRARGEVEQLVGRGRSTPPGDIPYTDRAKSVLGLSLREALHLGRDYIGTEHLLLALLHVEDGLAPVVVARLVGKRAVVRARVMELMDTEAGGDPIDVGPDARAGSCGAAF
jgi:ATP-dependent Clp protease ATP-binding subunit ClpC